MRSKECEAVSGKLLKKLRMYIVTLRNTRELTQGMREKLYPHKTPFFERGEVREGYEAERRPVIF